MNTTEDKIFLNACMKNFKNIFTKIQLKCALRGSYWLETFLDIFQNSVGERGQIKILEYSGSTIIFLIK